MGQDLAKPDLDLPRFCFPEAALVMKALTRASGVQGGVGGVG